MQWALEGDRVAIVTVVRNIAPANPRVGNRPSRVVRAVNQRLLADYRWYKDESERDSDHIFLDFFLLGVGADVRVGGWKLTQIFFGGKCAVYNLSNMCVSTCVLSQPFLCT